MQVSYRTKKASDYLKLFIIAGDEVPGFSGLEQKKRSSVKTEGLSERVMGIEPTCTAWKAVILPLNYTRMLFN